MRLKIPMDTSVTIRNAVLDDAAALAGLSGTLGYPASVQDVRERLPAIADCENDCVLVACTADGLVVGWIHVFLAHRIETDRFAELGGLVVAEDHRGEGIERTRDQSGVRGKGVTDRIRIRCGKVRAWREKRNCRLSQCSRTDPDSQVPPQRTSGLKSGFFSRTFGIEEWVPDRPSWKRPAP